MRSGIVLIVCLAQLALGQSGNHLTKPTEGSESGLRPNEIWEAQRDAFLRARFGALPESGLVGGPTPVEQRASESSGESTEVYKVPFGSRGNSIELSVKNSLETSSSVQIKLTSAPSWLKFSEREQAVSNLKVGETRVVSFWFDVENTAQVNTSQTLLYTIINGLGSTWTKEISISVLPPTTFDLLQNYPNPFNPTTTISYLLPSTSHVTLKIYNLLGQEVARPVDETQSSGRHEARWEAVQQASGIYVYEVRVTDERGEHSVARRAMVLMK